MLVYIREAHPTDGWSIETSGWSIIEDPKSYEERRQAAARTCSMLRFPFPVVVDSMDDGVAIRWSAWPERLFVVSRTGEVVYAGAQGPWGFWPVEASKPHDWGGPHSWDHGEPLDRFLEGFLADPANRR